MKSSFSTVTNCRFCQHKLEDVIHLGDKFPLAGGFMRQESEIKQEELFPLTLSLCPQCCLLHCKQSINPDKLFKQGYFYYSSKIPFLVQHFQQLADKIGKELVVSNNFTAVEIGCNDGVLLRPLSKYCRVIGVDPSDTVKNLIQDGFEIYNDYLSGSIAQSIVNKHGQIDLFISCNSFAHIDDMKTVLTCMQKMLKPGGSVIIEVHYAKHIITAMHVDFIYHEHLHYFTTTSFYKIGLQYGYRLENVELIPVHGGSLRIHWKKQGYVRFPEPLRDSVQAILQEEHELKLDSPSIFPEFSARLVKWKTNMKKVLQKYQRIYGYGSSGRANIICTLLDLKVDRLFDDSPMKVGSITPLYHVRIEDFADYTYTPGDAFIILAWPYKDAIVPKILQKGPATIIIPLPNIEVYGGDNHPRKGVDYPVN